MGASIIKEAYSSPARYRFVRGRTERSSSGVDEGFGSSSHPPGLKDEFLRMSEVNL
jgi:hypothetical protein